VATISSLQAAHVSAFFERWQATLLSPFTVEDRQRGYRYHYRASKVKRYFKEGRQACLFARERRRSLEVDEPLTLLSVLYVKRHLERGRLTGGHEKMLRLLDHVLDPLRGRVRSLEAHDDRVVSVVVGDVRQDLSLIGDLVS
jgi:hypothetical protein